MKLGTVALGTESIASTVLRSAPTVSIIGVLPFPTTVGTVSWTYGSLAGRAQVSFRVRVLAPTDLTILYDSGIVGGAVTAWNVPLTVQASSSYFVAVSVYDGFDWSDEAKAMAQAGSDDVLNFTPVESVGRVYEVGINGVGYMVSDNVDDLQYRRLIQNLQPPRFATTATPFSENIDHYSFVSFNDYSGGAGQLFLDRKVSVDASYFDSEGVDPWTPGRMQLLHSMDNSTPPIAGGRAAIYSNKLIMRTPTGLLSFDEPTNPVLYNEDFRNGEGAFVGYDTIDRPQTNNSVHAYDPGQVTTDASGLHIAADKKQITYEDFSAGTIDTHKWQVGGAPVITSGQLHITPTASYPSIKSNGHFALTSFPTFQVKVPQITSGGNNTRQTIFDIVDSVTQNSALRIMTVNGTIGIGTRVNGVDNLSFTAYNAVNHLYWRIRVATSGNTAFETSPDGTTWNLMGVVTTPTSWLYGRVVCQSGFFGTEVTPNDSIFDDIKITTWWSGLADTKTTLSFNSPVRIDVRMRINNYIAGGWPSWWMLPVIGVWPTDGEIDGMEYQGDGNVYGTIHGDNPFGSGFAHHWQQGGNTPVSIGSYHVFSMSWDTNTFTWYLDDVPYFTCDRGPNSPKPYDKPFYLILNLAMGGTWPGNPVLTTSVTMDVDYVKVTALSAATGSGTTTANFALSTFTPTDLCSDGTYWYVSDPAHGVRRNNSAADPGSNWSSVAARVIEYAGGRICAGIDSSGTANRFTTLGPDGTEEVVGGRLTLPAGWSITGFTGGSGFVWFGAKSGDRGAIYAWQAGSVDTPFVALDLPAGQWVQAVYYYLGNVFVRAGISRSDDGSTAAVIYRCAADASGGLSPFRVLDIGLTGLEGDYAPGNFSASDKYVFFSWPQMVSNQTIAGVGCVNLETGGYCKWVYGQAMANPYTIVWRNRVVITDVNKLSLEAESNYLTTGFVLTSVSDLNSSLDKVLDSITMSLSANDGNQGVTFEASYDGDRSTVDPGIGNLDPGTLSVELPWGKRIKSFGLKFTLNKVSGGTFFLGATVRLHPLGIADETIEVPINCSDRITDLRGVPLAADSGPGKGALRARTLMALAESRVLYQDVDYAITRVASAYEVVNAEIRSVGVNNPNQGRAERSYVVILSLRRRAK